VESRQALDTMNTTDLPFYDWLSAQIQARMMSVEMPVASLMSGLPEHPRTLGTIVATIALLAVLALACRSMIYFLARLRGCTSYTTCCQVFENVALGVATVAGIISGGYFFQNVPLALITGVAFFAACTGAMIEGIVTNEETRKTALLSH
jgi:hypothetical protein